ncbi:hypothetical protein OROMI_003690 [Orobanche minor]
MVAMYAINGSAAVNLKIAFLPLLAFEVIILIDNFSDVQSFITWRLGKYKRRGNLGDISSLLGSNINDIHSRRDIL